MAAELTPWLDFTDPQRTFAHTTAGVLTVVWTLFVVNRPVAEVYRMGIERGREEEQQCMVSRNVIALRRRRG